MSIKVSNINTTRIELRREVYIILLSFIPQIDSLGRRLKDEAYTSTFGRNPIDTGVSKKNTIFYIESQLRPYPFIKMVFESKKLKPFIYFAEPNNPKNPNFKYGNRNTLISARDNLAKKLGYANN